ncbi:hypothetical protein M0802_005909 [Mischocyttarus mexicanus]|nr:hypothetical protein M0802_005909 [Mischocyttarus mexicanus]
METTLNKEILTFVFKYLKNDDLKNASKVCRLWWETAVVELKLRGPMFVVRTDKHNVKSDESLITDSCLQVIFDNIEYDENFVDTCLCSFFEPGSYLVNLSNSDWSGQDHINIFTSLTFPETETTKIRSYTFISDVNNKELFWRELNFHCGIDIGRVKFLKDHMQSYFVDSKPCFMILLSPESSLTEFMNLILVLLEWYSESTIPIWGGIVDKMSVCHSGFQNKSCKVATQYMLIFIDNQNLKIWTHILNETDDTEEKIEKSLISLKNNLQLKLHSIALMFTSFYRVKSFYQIESSIFKKVFPNLDLYHLFGEAGFVAQGIRNLCEYTLRIPTSFDNKTTMHFETAIMIVTFD